MNVQDAVRRIGFIASFLTAGTVYAQSGFAGTITFAMHSKNGKDETMVQVIKGNKLRIEGMGGSSRGGGGAFIIDGGAKTTTILMNEQKMYMQFTADDMKNAADRVQQMIPPGSQTPPKTTPAERPKSDTKVTNTGRTETVAGVSCDVYRVSSTHEGKVQEGEVCMGKGVGFAPFQTMGGMGAAMMGGAPSAPDMSAYNDLMKENRGVLKVTSLEGGKPFVQMEATKIDRAVPSDEVFAVPAGFTKFQMPNIPGLKRPPGQ